MKEINELALDDYSVYYEKTEYPENPEEPVLIFLHDSWGCVGMWGDFPEKLMKIAGLNAFVYDRRGYGRSSPFGTAQRDKNYLHQEAGELIRVMDKANIRKAVLYGHSDGATIALIAAAKYPERIVAVIAESTHTFIEEKGKTAVLESRERAKHNSLLQTLEKYHGDKTGELFRRWHETWLSDNFADWSIIPLLCDIQCPVLAFRGKDDPYDSIEQQNVLKSEMSSPLTTAVIPDAGHSPRIDNETVTMKLIKSFLSCNSFE
ncbi:MAG TPA: alpha/beta hydrolase [Paludibacteraceae bacterium]|mgnify:CR=1 FL=1|nr:alpha/beta hydrolase [Paludibacteraceae bacterium]